MSGKAIFTALAAGYVLFGVAVTADWLRSRGRDTGAGASRLVLAGSTSVQPFAEKLAEEFMNANPGVEVIVQGGGSTAGIQAVRSAVAEIGMSSRNLKGDEKSLRPVVIARDAIAVIVHPDNPVRALTLDQVRDIFAGRIRTWDRVGGRPEEIVRVSREEGSGTLGAFREMVMRKVPQDPGSLVQDSNGAVRETVATSRRLVGFVSLQFLLLDDRVKGVAVDGVEPTADNAASGAYVLVRPFLFVTVDEPTGLALDFERYVLGGEGQRTLAAEGLVPSSRHGGAP